MKTQFSFSDASAKINQATDYFMLFGPVPDSDKPKEHVRKLYRQFSIAVYPERVEPTEEKAATYAFDKLSKLYQEALHAIERNTYGKLVYIATIAGKRATHNVVSALPGGDICSTYKAETKTKDGLRMESFIKIAKSPTDKDLLQSEFRALKRLREDPADSKFHVYFPELIESFSYANGTKRQANVLVNLAGFYSLKEIGKLFPHGVSMLDASWMWRRLLYTLGYAHNKGIVHGAVVPEHVMILPDKHGLVLVDWCYASVALDDGIFPPIKALINKYKDWYPDEVLQKQPPRPGTDMFMATKVMIQLTGGDALTGNYPEGRIGKPFRAFFKGCLLQSQQSRPQDAWQLLREFDELLEAIGQPYYPRKFRAFVMPQGVA